MVSPTYVFDGLICAIPARLRIGSDTSVAPELNSPMYAIAVESPTARPAFFATAALLVAPVAALESSSDTYLIV